MAGTEFDWSILDRKNLISMLWSLYPQVTDKSFTPVQLHSIIAKHIRKQLPVRVVRKMAPDVESGWVYIGGLYASDADEDYEKCIEINFNYCLFDSKITLTRKRFKGMCSTFADVILHEIIHMRQYRRREFKFLPDYESTAEKQAQRAEQGYLGCSDEIDAYSFNLACELLDRFKNDPKAVSQYIGKKHNKGKLKSHTLRMYLRAFDYDQNHRIIRRLKKRAIGYLPNAMLGRPYRTGDWINW